MLLRKLGLIRDTAHEEQLLLIFPQGWVQARRRGAQPSLGIWMQQVHQQVLRLGKPFQLPEVRRLATQHILAPSRAVLAKRVKSAREAPVE